MAISGFAKSKLTMIPTVAALGLLFYGPLLWTVYVSFTRSGLVPIYDFSGFDQYIRLFATPRWITASINIVILAVFGIGLSMIVGTMLAILIDQRVRFEGAFRLVYLYPQAISFIVTGLAFQWLLNPQMGIQDFVRALGFENFRFDWIVDRRMAIYTIVIALVWQSAGLVMAFMLAALRTVDNEIWKAIRIEGIPTWRAYVSIILPMLRPMIVVNIVLMALTVIRGYDLVVAMTAGGPGNATDVPGKFIIDTAFARANIGQASAAAVVMLAVVAVIMIPYLLSEFRRDRHH